MDHEGAKMTKNAKHEDHERSRRGERLRGLRAFVIQIPAAKRRPNHET
jgi:hypothetical protein